MVNTIAFTYVDFTWLYAFTCRHVTWELTCSHGRVAAVIWSEYELYKPLIGFDQKWIRPNLGLYTQWRQDQGRLDTTRFYTRNLYDSARLSLKCVHPVLCSRLFCDRLKHARRRNVQHARFIVKWFFIVDVMMSIQPGPHPYSMRLCLRRFVWPGPAVLVHPF